MTYVARLGFWKSVLAICCGSIGGALLRQVAASLFDTAADSAAGLVLAVSGAGGLLLGALLGVVVTARVFDERRQLLALVLVAALGTFGATAALVYGTGSAPAIDGWWYSGLLNILASLLAAAASASIVSRSRRS